VLAGQGLQLVQDVGHVVVNTHVRDSKAVSLRLSHTVARGGPVMVGIPTTAWEVRG
jgi:hypothetical protein